MKGFTNDYYQLFLDAEENFVETDLKSELNGDCSNYKVIYDKIRDLLNDPSGIGIDSLHIRKQLVIEEKLTPKAPQKIKNSLNIFQCIRDAITDKVAEFSNKELWVKAIQFSLLYYFNRKDKFHYSTPEEYEFIASSLFYLRNKGFNIECIDGHIKADDSELTRLFTALDYRANKLGKQGLINFISAVDKNYSRDEQRFFFYRKRSTIPTFQEPSPPHGYVFNLFCKNLNLSCKLKARDQEYFLNEIQDLSTHLATILDIDKFSPWTNINVGPENIIEKLTEWVLYPEIFYIPQISPTHGKRIFPRIFELIDNNTENSLTEIKKVSKVMEKIEDNIYQKGSISGELTEEQIYRLCLEVDTPKNIKKILNSISKPATEINKGYISPFEAGKANIKEFPLIKTKRGYIVVNIATYNIAKYRVLLKISEKYHSRTEQKLGPALEKFIKECFDKSNIDYHHNVKYSAPEYIKEISRTNRNKGECDFIIESSEYIYLIEVKKRGLTKESQSGHDLYLLLDTTLSFCKSVNQLTVAEIILLNEGKISYSNSDKDIQLNGREIFKLVISLEDMASLQCDNIKSQLLYGLYNIRIHAHINNDSTNNLVNRINKTLDEFTLLQSELMNKGEKYKHTPFHHVSYLSTPQLLTLLDDVNNNDDLAHNIYCSNSVIYSLMDWHASYKASKNSKLLKEHKSVFKNSVLIN